jgi:hypothetical protein
VRARAIAVHALVAAIGILAATWFVVPGWWPGSNAVPTVLAAS